MIPKSILVSKNIELDFIPCVTSLAEVDFTAIDCLVYHSSKDTDINAVMSLSDRGNSLKKVIYINSEIDPVYFAIFTGLDADIYNVESYLTEKDVLSYLISDYKNTKMTITPVSSDLETLQKLLGKGQTRSPEELQELFSNKFLVKTVSKALSNVEHAVTRAYSLNGSLIDMFSDTRKLINELIESHQEKRIELQKMLEMVDKLEQSQKEELQELRDELKEERALRESFEGYMTEVEELKKRALQLTSELAKAKEVPSNMVSIDKFSEKEAELELVKIELQKEKGLREQLEKLSTVNTGLSMGVTSFPSIDVPLTVPKVLHIQVLSPCRFLNSFILGFQNYMKNTKRRHTKVLFVNQKLPRIVERYARSGIPLLSTEAIKFAGKDMQKHDIYVTFEPIKLLMDFFLTSPNVDLFIVVDYLYGDPIVKGARTKFIHATGNPSDIDVLGLNPVTTITPIVTVKDSIRIAYIGSFPTAPAERIAEYSKKQAEPYEKLYSIIDS